MLASPRSRRYLFIMYLSSPGAPWLVRLRSESPGGTRAGACMSRSVQIWSVAVSPQHRPGTDLDIGAQRRCSRVPHCLDRPGSWWFTANRCPALPSIPRQIIEIQFGHSHAQSVVVDNRAQQSETPNGRAGSSFMSRNSTAIFNTERPENVSPVFEAWLRAYRTRLEQACIDPSPAKSRES
jgi:hypothetical protein